MDLCSRAACDHCVSRPQGCQQPTVGEVTKYVKLSWSVTVLRSRLSRADTGGSLTAEGGTAERSGDGALALGQPLAPRAKAESRFACLRTPNHGPRKDLLPRYYAFEDPRGPLERNIQSSVWKKDGNRPSLCEFARRVIQLESSIYFYVARKSYT